MILLRFPEDGNNGGGGGTAAPAAPPTPSTPAPAAPAPSTPARPPAPFKSGSDAPTPPTSQLTKVFKPDMSLVEDDTITVGDNKTNINPATPAKPAEPVATTPVAPVAPVIKPTVATPIAPPATPVAQPLVKLPTAALPTVTARDYSGYDEPTVAALKSMSNEAFDYTTKLIKQNREASNASFLQHPSGYILSPDYQKIVQDNHYLRMEGQIHQANLMKAVEGVEFAPLRGFDRQGNPVYEPARKPTTQDVELLRQQVGAALQSIGQTDQQMQNFAGQYKTVINNAETAIATQRAQLFEWAAKPEVMNQQIEVDGQQRTIKDVHNDIVKLFPPWYQGLATTPVIGDLWVAYKLQQAETAKLQQEIATLKAKSTEPAKVEPTSQNGAPAGGGSNDKGKYGGPKVFSLAGLND